MEKITSTYIHIPFCSTICSYCDFCKQFYYEPYVGPYLDALEKEIEQFYRGEIQQTIYIGGGTPTVLNPRELERLFQILQKLNREENLEFTVEATTDSLTEEKIKLFQKYGVNRVSIGIETIHPSLLKILNRRGNKEEIAEKTLLLKKYNIKNINVDLMYAIPGETLKEVKEDIEFLLSLEVPHISTYSLILEEHTKLYIEGTKTIDEDLDFAMYQFVTDTLEKEKYSAYEFSNFSKENYFSRHNMCYWSNYPYYGFGLGASGFVDSIRYTNTKSIREYCNQNYRLEEEFMNEKMNMENEMIVGLRTEKGISKQIFFDKYKKKMEEVFPIQKLKEKGLLEDVEECIRIPKSKWYLSNEILIEFIKE